ncbi:MAG TPA: hypothetical protein VKY74_23485 [Chloroflexia bacterium]|nr:hypothetical protein [Chloroflexia bacterium]
MSDKINDIEAVILIIAHPFGDLEVSLKTWMETGPGPRQLIRPVAAKSMHTGKMVPLSVIPLRYRNNSISRALITLGILPNPWKRI